MRKKRLYKGILLLAAAVLSLVFFVLAVNRLDAARRQAGQEQLEQALRRTAAACYAAEGAYPSDLQYLCDHYGIRYDESRYTVHYEMIASNLMPDITVVVNTHEE